MDSEHKKLTLPQIRRICPRLTPATLKYKVDSKGRRQRLRPRVNRYNRQRKSHSPSHRCDLESEDSRHLAADHRVVLPSDRSRSTPRLQRQEAFKIPKTQPCQDLVADDHELYRLGLLYDDDDYRRGPGFTLNSITHSEPLYTIRPARRQRGRRTAQCAAAQSYVPLELELEMSAFTDDEALARLLAAGSDAYGHQDHYARAAPSHGTPLTVIYELERSTHSLAAPLIHEYPDLVSDSDGDDEDFLMLDGLEDESLDYVDMDVDATMSADGALVDAADAWVVLGDGS
jgi:hypothetical protein